MNRNACDPTALEIRSQLSVTVPVSDQGTASDTLKAMEDARRQLATLSDREYEAVKSLFGADATLKAANTNSNMQDSGYRGRIANVSVMTTYEVKKSQP